MYIVFILICIALIITIAFTFKPTPWVLSLTPMALSPVVISTLTTSATPFMWVLGTLVVTSLPLFLFRNYNNNSKTFMSTMATLCATCAAEIILLGLLLIGCDIVMLFSTLTLVTWSTILAILLRKHYDHIGNTLHTCLHIDYC